MSAKKSDIEIKYVRDGNHSTFECSANLPPGVKKAIKSILDSVAKLNVKKPAGK